MRDLATTGIVSLPPQGGAMEAIEITCPLLFQVVSAFFGFIPGLEKKKIVKRVAEAENIVTPSRPYRNWSYV